MLGKTSFYYYEGGQENESKMSVWILHWRTQATHKTESTDGSMILAWAIVRWLIKGVNLRVVKEALEKHTCTNTNTLKHTQKS